MEIIISDLQPVAIEVHSSECLIVSFIQTKLPSVFIKRKEDIVQGNIGLVCNGNASKATSMALYNNIQVGGGLSRKQGCNFRLHGKIVSAAEGFNCLSA